MQFNINSNLSSIVSWYIIMVPKFQLVIPGPPVSKMVLDQMTKPWHLFMTSKIERIL